MQILLNIVLVIFVLVALLMILVILMQRPKSEGLGAAFGGGMTENLFGAQTTNVLVKITGWLAGIFFALTFLLSILYAHRTTGTTGLRQELMKTENNAPGAPAGSPAVGAPNTVTNPTPGMAEGSPPPGPSAAPADQAVGLSAPAVTAPPVESPAGSPPAQP
ncbi:MAG TPA: preprotein translocase subunit SecG [Chthoniobacterales bacterium]|jgi:preprotein translocase subunit SecG